MHRLVRSTPRAMTLTLLAGAASAALSPSAPGAQVVTSWLTPSSGSWTTASNWSAGAPNNNVPPGTTYDVLIDAMGGPYTVTLNTTATVDRLRLDADDALLLINYVGNASAFLTVMTDSVIDRGVLEVRGTLNGAGDVTINSHLIMNRGNFAGTGSLHVSAGATTTLGLTSGGIGLSRPFVNEGHVQWAAPNFSTLAIGSATHVNETGASFVATGQTDIRGERNAPARFDNRGLFARNGIGETALWEDVSFNNSGVLRVESGVASIGKGESSGVFEILAGAKLNVRDQHTFTPSATFLGGGEIAFSAGAYTFSTDAFQLLGTLTASGAALNLVGPGALVIDTLKMGGGLTVGGDVITSLLSQGPGGSFESSIGGNLTAGRLTGDVLGHWMTVHGDVTVTESNVIKNSRIKFEKGLKLPGDSLVSIPSGLLLRTGIHAFNDVSIFEGTYWTDGETRIANSMLADTTVIEGITPESRIVIAPEATFTLQSANDRCILHPSVQNAGVLRWASGGLKLGRSTNLPSVIDNLAGASILFESSGVLTTSGVTSRDLIINNAGLFQKTSSTSSWIGDGVTVNNSGEIDVRAGTLSIVGNTVNTGLIKIAPGATLELAGSTSGPDATIISAGTFRVLSGQHAFAPGRASFTGALAVQGGSLTLNDHVALTSLSISGGQLTLNAGLSQPPRPLDIGWAAQFSLSGPSTPFTSGSMTTGSRLTGASNITFTDNFTWTDGTMDGAGRTTLTPGTTLTLTKGTLGRALDIGGTLNWLSNAQWAFTAAAHLTILDGATFNTTANANTGSTSNGFLTNLGVLNRSGAGTTTIRANFENRGSVNLLQGNLVLAGGGQHSGSFSVASGALLELGGATHTFQSSASLDVDGALTLSAPISYDKPLTIGQTLTLAGSWSYVKPLTVGQLLNINTGADAQFFDTITAPTCRLQGGAATLNGPASFNSLVFTGGTLSGSADVTVAGPGATWLGGAMTGSGRTIYANAVSLTMSTGNRTLARTLDSFGATNWVNGAMTFGDGASAGVWNNHIGATFSTDYFTTIASVGSNNAFNNLGTFNRTGAGTTTFSSGLAFNNHGAVYLQGGGLHLLGGGYHTGAFNITPGASFRLNGAHSFTPASTISALQTVIDIAGGNTSFNGLATAQGFLVNPGATLSGSGTINAAVMNNGTLAPGAPHGGLLVNGAYTQTAAASLLIDIFSPINADRLTITGPASLAGTLTLTLDTNAFTPQWGQSWTVAWFGALTGDFSTFTATPVDSLNLRWWRAIGANDYVLGLRHVADTNHDGLIDFLDLNNVLGTFGQSATGSFGQLGLVGDANEDGHVDFLDLNIVLAAFGQSATPQVPAPSTAVLLALLPIAPGHRRRRRN